VNKRDIGHPDDSMPMFVGLDLHKKYTEVAIVDEGGVKKQERIENESGRIEEFSDGLSNAGMVLESSSSWRARIGKGARAVSLSNCSLHIIQI